MPHQETSRDKSLEALHNDWCKCNGPVIIEVELWGCLQHNIDGGGLESFGNGGGTVNVSEHICQLICTFSEYSLKDVIWSFRLSLPDYATVFFPQSTRLLKLCKEFSSHQLQSDKASAHWEVWFPSPLKCSVCRTVKRSSYHKQVLLTCSLWCPGCPSTCISCYGCPNCFCGFSSHVHTLLLWWLMTVWPLLWPLQFDS